MYIIYTERERKRKRHRERERLQIINRHIHMYVHVYIYIRIHINYHIYVTNMTQHCVLPGKSDPTQTHRELLMSAFETPSAFLVSAQTAV